MTEFSLDLLLKAIKLARWTYYYHLKQLDKTDKDQELKAEIQSIFIEHKGNYAYRCIHLELRNRAYLVYLAVSSDSSRSNELV
ncbi:transposase InsK for insertion sequence [Streptococcus pneumoniae]|nr:transposase InsK for insertion sequence [Streptococcus pneumoniae]